MLFVHHIVNAVFGVVFVHVLLGVDLGKALELQGFGKTVGALIEVGGLVALTGNNERCTRFVDQNGVHLVHDRKGVAALHLVLLVNDHVVAQVVKAQLVVGAVGNIRVVGGLSAVVVEIVYDQTDLQTHILVELAHPFGVAARQIVVDGDDVHALAGQRVQICRQGRHKGLAFTGFHFGDPALMEHDAADDLHRKVLHAQHTPACLAAGGKGVGQNIVGGLAVCQTLLEQGGLVFQLALRHCGIFFFQRQHLVGDRLNALDFALAVVAKHCF